MTTDLQAVRQAAERCMCKSPSSDNAIMRDYILATIPADGHLAIDAEWLRDDCGIINDPDADDDDMFLICPDSDTFYILRRCWVHGKPHYWRLYFDDVESDEWPLPLRSRHEVSTLLNALGIQRKRKDGKK